MPTKPEDLEQISVQAKSPPLPKALVAAVHDAPPQDSLTNYDTLHSWWWAVYDEVLADLKVAEPEAWRDVDQYVKH